MSSSSFQTEDPPAAERAEAFSTDWDRCYREGRLRHGRGRGTRAWSRFDRDLEALRWLGVSHYRFSVEWARVEPRPGRYDDEAIARYAAQARALRAAGMEPVVCLWHFTFPDWLADRGAAEHGFLHPLAPRRWDAYVERVVRALAGTATLFAPQNEPNMQSFLGFVGGVWPPMAALRFGLQRRSEELQIEAFRRAATMVRDLSPGARILSVQNVVHWQRSRFDPGARFFAFTEALSYRHLDGIHDVVDLVGFNYYCRELASPAAPALMKLRSRRRASDLGWIIDPDGLERVAEALHGRYGKPLVVLENGIDDRDDSRRADYIRSHVAALGRARSAGIDVRGYFHWTLVDNFEWAEGFAPRFGLFALDEGSGDLVRKRSAEDYRALISERRRAEAG